MFHVKKRSISLKVVTPDLTPELVLYATRDR